MGGVANAGALQGFSFQYTAFSTFITSVYSGLTIPSLQSHFIRTRGLPVLGFYGVFSTQMSLQRTLSVTSQPIWKVREAC